MEDQEVAVILQINLNERKDEAADSSWESAANNLSVIESNEQKISKYGRSHTVEEDYEFIKKHATNIDPNILNLILDSQINNPKRLETVMCDVLNIPNALELIKNFKENIKLRKQESHNNFKVEQPEVKQKTGTCENYLNQIHDMFPDADRLFLTSECQHLKTQEDCSRFINTVMISGVYPKNQAIEFNSENSTQNFVEIINDYQYTTGSISSEEVSSSDPSQSFKRRRRSESKNSDTYLSPKKKIDDIKETPAVVDLVENDDITEPYNPPDQATLNDQYKKYNNIIAMEVDEYPSIIKDMERSIADDVDYIFQEECKTALLSNDNISCNSNTLKSPVPRPSTSHSPRLSFPGRTLSFDEIVVEKSLAEIIEDRRRNRGCSLDSHNLGLENFQRPSTSQDKADLPSITFNSIEKEFIRLGSPDVSSSSVTDSPANFVDYVLAEENDDISKLSEEWLNEQTANLIRIFPSTDPSFLKEEVMKMNMSSEAMNAFVIAKLEKNDMPTRAEYEKRREMEELQNRYTKNFSIEDFLKAIPDPWKYFNGENRNCDKYKKHSLCYLKSSFRRHYVRDIIDIFSQNNSNLYVSYKVLKESVMRNRGIRRSEFECNSHRPTTIDIQFLQEVAFIENEDKIRDYIENKKIYRQLKFEEAKRVGRLLECQCCFDSEVMVEDIVYCPKDHSFCKECVTKSVEVEMGNGKCQFECLSSCDEKFSLSCLQNVIKPELFSKIIQAIQLEEIRAAEIEDLVQCPFCNYATIMPPEEKVMTCLNPECLKESCRICKELNHIPLRCDEIEKSEDVKMRTYIENKMTEALVRTCYKCKKKFVKEDGCNKMTCTCGAKMCYVCRKPVSDYSHFNGQGGTEYHKCPLYSTNDELHVDLVKKIGEEAKAKILQSNPQGRLLHDPTIIMPERSHDHPVPGMNNRATLNAGLRAVRGILNELDENEDEQDINQRHRRPITRRHSKTNVQDIYFRSPLQRYTNHCIRKTANEETESEDDDNETYQPGRHNNHRYHHQNHRHSHHHHHHHHHHHRDN